MAVRWLMSSSRMNWAPHVSDCSGGVNSGTLKMEASNRPHSSEIPVQYGLLRMARTRGSVDHSTPGGGTGSTEKSPALDKSHSGREPASSGRRKLRWMLPTYTVSSGERAAKVRDTMRTGCASS